MTLPASVGSTNLIVRPKTDGVYEDTETVVLTLTADAAYQIATNAPTATITTSEIEGQCGSDSLAAMEKSSGSNWAVRHLLE